MNRKTTLQKLAGIAMLALLITGCSSSTDPAGTNPAASGAQTGIFQDSPVNGIHYWTTSFTDVANQITGTVPDTEGAPIAGSYRYQEGDTVKFFLDPKATLLLGEATAAKKIVTPEDLIADAQADDPGVTNILRTLQTLNTGRRGPSGAPLSGDEPIVIRQEVVEAGAKDIPSLLKDLAGIQTDQMDIALQDLTDTVNKAMGDTPTVTLAAVSETAARNHFEIAKPKAIEERIAGIRIVTTEMEHNEDTNQEEPVSRQLDLKCSYNKKNQPASITFSGAVSDTSIQGSADFTYQDSDLTSVAFVAGPAPQDGALFQKMLSIDLKNTYKDGNPFQSDLFMTNYSNDPDGDSTPQALPEKHLAKVNYNFVNQILYDLKADMQPDPERDNRTLLSLLFNHIDDMEAGAYPGGIQSGGLTDEELETSGDEKVWVNDGGFKLKTEYTDGGRIEKLLISEYIPEQDYGIYVDNRYTYDEKGRIKQVITHEFEELMSLEVAAKPAPLACLFCYSEKEFETRLVIDYRYDAEGKLAGIRFSKQTKNDLVTAPVNPELSMMTIDMAISEHTDGGHIKTVVFEDRTPKREVQADGEDLAPPMATVQISYEKGKMKDNFWIRGVRSLLPHVLHILPLKRIGR